MQITVLTLFPDIFPGPLEVSLIGKALKKDLWNLRVVDLKKFTVKGRVDAFPCGGGCGMLLSAIVLETAIASLSLSTSTQFMYLSPRGALFSQETAHNFSKMQDIVLLCGRYEGVDARFLEKYNFIEISVGDYILMGGEVAAMAVIEASVRLIPGVVGTPESLQEDSFVASSASLLEYPQYTHPVSWEERSIPSVLLSGNHTAVNQWRFTQACATTRIRRPDLWHRYVAWAFKKS
ncbi:MAG: tRNA (guanosine(37)-N1)-methyltransferase TrmD [Holosporales bacterium]|jgi:tRNA (guanine37-N1)-methyltransferase|nr:tRNA (guanosine(37)-N1)-methyltransferase TrmD [Holosporales bacterium]